jgi:protoporphyrin/coproporphyrin ferrochelatase
VNPQQRTVAVELAMAEITVQPTNDRISFMPPAQPSAYPYDALLLVSFGGPEKPDDVLPFLENVTRGRSVPQDRLRAVGEHYFARGGRSPINDQCRDLIAALRADFAARRIDLPVYWGNRNWHPHLDDAVRRMADDGVRRAAYFVTSMYASYSGCRQYRENLFEAVHRVRDAPALDRLRHGYDHPGFITAFADATVKSLADIGAAAGTRLVFVTHSIPTAMAQASGVQADTYVAEHLEVAGLVASAVAERTGREHQWDLAYCSRSGRPDVPWLAPDINERLATFRATGVTSVVVVPIGFVSDHMEVVQDLDTEAAATADRLGLRFARAATPGTHPAFVAMIRDLVLERAAVERGGRLDPVALGQLDAHWGSCPPGCCPNPSGARNALAGSDS